MLWEGVAGADTAHGDAAGAAVAPPATASPRRAHVAANMVMSDAALESEAAQLNGAGEAAAAASAGGDAGLPAQPRSKRGRKRKPRMPELQAHLEALTAQFSRLHQENEFLKNKLKVLERVVPYRDESAAALTQLMAAAAAAAQAAAEQNAAAAAGACEDSSYSESEGSESDYDSEEGDETLDSSENCCGEWRRDVHASVLGDTVDGAPAAGPAGGPAAALAPPQVVAVAAAAWHEVAEHEADMATAMAGASPGPQGSSLPACSGSSDSYRGPPPGANSTVGKSRGRSSGGGDGASQGPSARAPQLPPRPAGSRPSRTAQLKPDPGQNQQHQQQSSASARTARQLQSSQQQTQQQATSSTPQQPRQQVAVLALCPAPDGEPPELTAGDVEELRRVTPEQFRLLWKHICMQLGVLVAGAEVHGPGSAPFGRLERFLERCLAYVDKISLLAPACFVHSMYMNIETGQPERPPDSFWMTCARALQLTPAQLAEVTSLASVYEQNVVPVVQQRLQLAARLSDTLAAATAAPATGGETLTALSEVDALAEQLQRNVLKEHQAHWDIGDFLCSSVLTRFQVAKALTVCFPHIPDGVAMLHAFKILSEQLKQEQQQKEQLQQLEQHRAAAAAAGAVAAPTWAPLHTAAAAAAPRPAAALAGSQQTFPTLAGLLVCHLPQLAAWTVATAPAVAVTAAGAAPVMPPCAITAVPAVATAPVAAAAPAAAAGALPLPLLQPAFLQGFLGMLQPEQLQGLVAMLQPAQLQALLQSLSPAQVQQLFKALQPAQLQAVLTALQPAQLHAVLSVLPAAELPALLGRLPPEQLQTILAVLQEQQRLQQPRQQQ
ncbi:hypothetical protein HXX76_013790 [Chlamydomonas incerta]|uniref:Magnesium transporter MgtE intracellular domain-containing protein n=1 Tax=Chlamydomonas incerta TaxID=51695 RepID=A0A835ST25_CHLIN|nr:hypothetical protein HXX76_013790 [Chlamydomonas incerta]|eukprot:KAG2425376.1 hypothetical protein HXX76_013790 [Chlamydomonas incerta]